MNSDYKIIDDQEYRQFDQYGKTQFFYERKNLINVGERNQRNYFLYKYNLDDVPIASP